MTVLMVAGMMAASAAGALYHSPRARRLLAAWLLAGADALEAARAEREAKMARYRATFGV